MRRLVILLLASLMLAGAANAQKAQSAVDWALKERKKAGHVYAGVIWSGGSLTPGETVFDNLNSATPTGWYTYGYEKATGELFQCVWWRPQTLACRWSDTNGKGPVLFTFNDDKTVFGGSWGMHSPQHPWNGRIK